MKNTSRKRLWQRLLAAVSQRGSRRPGVRPILESLEDRTLPSSVAPFVQSINRTTPANALTNATSVVYTVTFSEPVTGVDPTDFQLAQTGTVGTTLTQVASVSPSVYTLTVSGITGNGTLGLNLVNNGSIRDLAGDGLISPNTVSFQSPLTFAIGPRSPGRVVAADVNGDGKPDIVTADFDSSSVSVLLGNGDGTFQTQATYAAGYYPAGLAVADVNGDGKPDIVVVSTDYTHGKPVSVLLGNGNGTFQSAYSFATSSSLSYGLSIADVNGDGKPDLILTNDPISGVGTSNVGVLLGNGNGTFQSQMTFATGVNPRSVVVADLNGDGKPDLVVGNPDVGTTSVLLGNGNGTFQSQSILPAGPRSLAVADVNGDGKPDIVFGSGGAPNYWVGVLLANGDGTFQTPVIFPTGLLPTSIAVADMNADSKADVVVLNTNSYDFSVLLGNGDGTFGSQISFPTFASISMAVADFNGDNKPDVVVANMYNNSVSVFVNNTNGSFNGQLYTIDSIAPFVESINSTNPAGPLIYGGTVNFTVTFSEPVTGVNVSDFQLAEPGGMATAVTPVSASVYTVTVAGIAGNGALGLNLVDDGSIHDLAGNPLAQQNAQPSFNTGLLSVGSFPNSVFLADVNGDGEPDLVVANKSSNTVGVLLGNGNGSFQAQHAFATGSDPTSVAVADVNDDGKPDLVVANSNGSTVSVLLGNGNGAFQAQQTISVGSSPWSVAVGDVNGDGKPDIVVANLSSSTVSVLLSNGNGTFQTQQVFATGLEPFFITLGDVNGDGKPDLVVANAESNTVSVLLGNGNGTFQAQLTFATGIRPTSVALGDINGDGTPDLVVANAESNSKQVSVLLGNGNGTFQAQQLLQTGYGPNSVALGDVNGDGKPDIIAANQGSNTISVLLGNGNGTFQAQRTFGPVNAPYAMALGDVNGDGRPDLAVVNQYGNTLSMVLNADNGDFTGQVYTIDTNAPFVESITRTTAAGPITNSSTVSFTVTFNELVTGVNPTDFQMATTGTVGTTLTQVAPVSPSVYTVTVSGITGNGTLGLDLVDNGSIRGQAGGGLVQPNAPATFFSKANFPVGQEPYSVAAADVNGDGIPDMVVANYSSNNVSVLQGNGDGTFQSQTTFAAGAGPSAVAVADINHDNNPDIVVTNTSSSSVGVLFGNGDGSFHGLQTFATGSGPTAVAVADVNGDSKSDLVTANAAENAASVLVGNGNGTFQSQTTFAAGLRPDAVAVADFNGDNNLDLVFANYGSASVSLLLSNGNGTFQGQAVFSAGPQPISVAVADVNGDGNLDLVVANHENPGALNILLGNGNGTFQAPSSIAVGSDPTAVAVADMNGDGKPDLIVANGGDNTVSVLLGNGNGTFQGQTVFATGFDPRSVTVADVNGDGRSDLVVANQNDNDVSVLLNAGNGNTTGPVYTIDTVAPFIESINRTTPAGPIANASTVTFTVTFSEPVTGVNPTDFQLAQTGTVGTTLTQVTQVSAAVYTVTVSGITGNGTLGLNLVDNSSIHDLAGNTLTQQNAPAAFSTGSVLATGKYPKSMVLADVNGDGKPDLVVANASNSFVSVMLGNGDGTFQAQQTFATFGYGAQSVLTGDLTNDGKQDLVITSNGGLVTVLLANGDGTFQVAESFEAGEYGFSAALADVNGDGNPDVIVGHGPNSTTPSGTSVGVLLGTGNGSLQLQFQPNLFTSLGTFAVQLADLTGDGKPDIVLTNDSYNSDMVRVLLGNGDGTFQDQQIVGTGALASALALSDVNGDGKPDIVVANPNNNTVSVLLGNGNGTFQPRHTFATGTMPESVAISDVNGDGKPDIVVANYRSNSVSVLLGNGNGTFQAQQTFAAGNSPNSIVVGEVNSDGRPDIAVTNRVSNTVSVLLNASNGNFTGQAYTIDTVDPFVVSINRTTPTGPATNAGTVSFTVTFNEPVTGVVASDFQLVLTGTATGTVTQVTPGSGADYTVTVGGITGNGTVGLNLVDNGTIHDVAGKPLSQRNAQAAFQAEQTFASGSQPLSVAVADLTGSGILDLAVANYGSNTVSVFLGNGNSTFQAQQTYATGPGPTSVATGDFNGDGKTDLVVGNGSSNTVSVLLANGNGTFQAQQTFANLADVDFATVADVNGDGILDLIVANQGASVSVLLGNGNGTFQAEQYFITGMEPLSVAVADVNGDGKPDLVVANRGLNLVNGNFFFTVSVLLGNGNGTFQAQQMFETGGSTPLGNDPRSIAVADVNGDGKADIAVANFFSNTLSLLLGNGNGTFQAQQTFTAGREPVSVAVADLNGDGKPDLVVANEGATVSVFLGNGNGTFQAQQSFLTGASPYAMALSDVNGDGRPDLVVANRASNSVGVLLNGGNGNFTGQVYTIGTFDAVAPFVESIDRTPPAGAATSATAVTFTVTFNEPVTGVIPNDFQLVQTETVATTLTQVIPISASVYTVTFSGITGIGTLGLYLIDNRTIHDLAGDPLTQQNAPALFDAGSVFPTGANPHAVVMADVNGDGYPDLVLVNRDSNSGSVLVGNGNGTFQAQQTFATGNAPLALAVGDLNGDGMPDLVVANSQGSSLSVLLSNGNGTFQAQQILATSSSPLSVSLDDVNADGTLDLIVGLDNPSAVGLLLGNGNGTFQALQTIATGSSPFSIAVNDVNGDGKPDLVVGNDSQQTVSVLLGNGNGTFQAQQTYATGSNPYSVALADVNGDGKPDVVVADSFGNAVSVLLGNGNGTFQAQQIFATGSGPVSVAVGDVNGDLQPDLVVTNEGSDTVSVLLGNGNGTFQTQQTFATGSAPFSVALGDVDGDDTLDIAVANSGNNTVSVLLNAGNGSFTGQLYTIDTVDPFVESIDRTTPPGVVTNGSSVIYTVTFSEPVTGVVAGDFQVALTGTATGTVTQVSTNSAAVYTVTVSGISGGGTVGLNLVDNGTIRDQAGNTLTQPNAALTFQAQETIATGNEPGVVALVDLTGDGKLDLVLSYEGGGGTVLLGNGNGTFQGQQTFAANVGAFAVGDVNGDGKPDLVVTYSNSDVASLLLGNGNGTFQAGRQFGYYLNTTQIVLADVNGDGTLDLVATNLNGGVNVLLGNGNGTFQGLQGYNTGQLPLSVAVADLNGDDKPDLVVANFQTSYVSVLLGNGNGTFQAQQEVTTPALPFAVAVGDVNGDGKPDLLVTAGGVNVLLGNGNGTFQAPHAFGTGNRAFPEALADVNGDGQADIITAAYQNNTVSVILGNGNGSFQPPDLFTVGTHPHSVAVGDLNGDGKPDIVAANQVSNTVSVLLNAANGNFTGQLYIINNAGPATHFVIGATPTDVTAGASVTFTVTAEDVNNDTAVGYTGTVAFSSSDTAAILPNLSTLFAGVGVFTATLKTAGTQILSATDTATSSITGASSTILVNPGAATHFGFTGIPSGAVTAGTGFGFTVTAEDQFNNTDFAYGGTVALSSSDPGAVFGPMTRTLANGQGPFSVTLKTAGTQTLGAHDTTNGTISGTSNPVSVPAAAFTHFLIAGTPSSLTAGTPFAFTVTADDAFNNIASGYSGSVRFSSNDTGATLPPASTLTAGVGIFSATLITAGSRTLTATDTATGTIAATSSPIAVLTGATAHFSLSAPGSVGAGQLRLFTVTAQDRYNNTAPSYTGTADFTTTAGQAVLSDPSTLTNGVGLFGVVLETAGKQTIFATDTLTGSITGASGTIVVSPGAATHFGVAAISVPSYAGIPAAYPGLPAVPSSFATAGMPFNFGVTAEDQFNNLAPTYTGTVHFASSDSAATLPASGTLSGGGGTFTATLASPGNQSITATDVGNPSLTGTSSAVVVRGLVVTGFNPTPSGFSISFNQPFVTSAVNLYTTGTLPDSVILATTNSQVSVRGSLVIDPSGTSFTFVKTATVSALGAFNPTSGLLAAGTYTVTLRSYSAGSSGFKDALGDPLDGTNSGGSANYRITFVVTAPPVAVGIPDFARGPSNTDALFLPPTLTNGSTFALSYTNPLTSPMTGTATVTFSTTAATLQSNIQNALSTGGLATQIGVVSPGGTPNAVVVVTNDTSTGANVLVTFQGALAQTTNQLLTSTTPGVAISLAPINAANNMPTSGIPIALTSGQGVTSGSFTLQYNPSLLNITGVVSKIPGASFTFIATPNTPTSATLVLSLSSPSPISSAATAITLGSLLATVPLSAAASYGTTELLHFSSEQLSGTGGPIPITNQDGVQVVAYFGDVTDSGGPFTLQDAVDVSSAAGGVPNPIAQTLPGFTAFPAFDPVLIGDVALQGSVNPTDAGAMIQQVAGSARATIPYAPIGLPVTLVGPDQIGLQLVSNTVIQSTAGGSLTTIALPVRQDVQAGTPAPSVQLVSYVAPTGGLPVCQTHVADAQAAFVLRTTLSSSPLTADGVQPAIANASPAVKSLAAVSLPLKSPAALPSVGPLPPAIWDRAFEDWDQIAGSNPMPLAYSPGVRDSLNDDDVAFFSQAAGPGLLVAAPYRMENADPQRQTNDSDGLDYPFADEGN